MRNLLNFLSKYNNLLVFILLQIIAIYLLSTANDYHNTQMVKGIRRLTIGIEKRISNARTYFQLREISRLMAVENSSLRTRLERLSGETEKPFFSVTDTVFNQQYTFTHAEVINNSVNRQKNFFTIDRGRRQGMLPDMAVTEGDHIAGIIVGCSDNYSVVMSLLNLDFRVSARLRSTGYFGSMTWEGRDPYHVVLSEIPQHVTFGVGDTVETTGYSTIFPEGIIIGTVSGFEKTGGDFYRIDVAISTDFRRLRHVTVVGNLMKEEQLELENQYQ
ncbi:MAG TPA: rod shape-determining protein MreC [Bacteroidales bacterium]|nr:rod shape-determining protein MreC [Bacteroidales bacterium]HPF01799.1 rod shape-determining protein MreC [Bacteroidales bacterium]HPJ59707.1 rod shape-determining protein MreC [Bacteroidales bacterium]HPR11320.1 rod shape-determining protein MreC [Bacteroidales bacterium]